MIALLRAELAAQRPWWVAAVGVAAVGVLATALEPVSQLWLMTVLGGLQDWGLTVGVLAFAVGHGTVARDFRSGAIEWLDALPVSRTTAFASRWIAGGLWCVCLVGMQLTIDALGLWMASGPGTMTPAGALLAEGMLVGAFILGSYGLGAALSWFGGLGWGLFLIGWFALGTIGLIAPVFRPIDPLMGSYFDLRMHGAWPVFAWQAAIGYLTLYVACGLASWVGWLGPGERLVASGSLLGRIARVGTVGCLATMLIGLAGLVSLVLVIDLGGEVSSRDHVRQVGSFRVMFSADPETNAPVLALVDELPAIDADIRELLGHDGPLPLDLEFMGSGKWHSGRYSGGKIRLRVERKTLIHELAHAHSFAVGREGPWRHAGHVRFFTEGIAEWVELELSDDPQATSSTFLSAALAHATDQSDFFELVDDKRRTEKRDTATVYPLGFAFVTALADVYGREAPSAVMAALADVPAGTGGVALWYTIFDACGYELDQVLARYHALLEEHLVGVPMPLPRLVAHLADSERGPILVVEDREHTDSTVWWCRFRDSVNTPLNQYDQTGVEDGSCQVPRSSISGSTFWFQVGFQLDGADSIFGEWHSLPTP
jgi:hypothetical protein